MEPAYNSKSPVDGSRNYSPLSRERSDARCGAVLEWVGKEERERRWADGDSIETKVLESESRVWSLRNEGMGRVRKQELDGDSIGDGMKMHVEESKKRVFESNGDSMGERLRMHFLGPKKRVLESDVDSMEERMMRHVLETKSRVLDLQDSLCSFGPEQSKAARVDALVYDSKGELVQNSVHTALDFHDVCVMLNVDSSKRVQRGLLLFDPKNNEPHRCVACPNPIENVEWEKHPCGVMWTHQINAKSTLGDFKACYAAHEKMLTTVAQHQSPADEGLKGGILYFEPTLLLSFAHKNPGHQLWDSLYSLIPLILHWTQHGDLSMRRVVVHQSENCPEEEWLCSILRKLGVITDSNLVPLFTGMATCFRTLVVPKWGFSRVTVFSSDMLRSFRKLLYEKFDLKPILTNKTKPRLLLYAHQSKSAEVKSNRRTWRKAEDFAVDPKIVNAFDVHLVHDFSKMTAAEQVREFYEADVVLMPHGGQFGNAFFAKDGTIIIEVSCNGYSHLGLSADERLIGSTPRALGFLHVALISCACIKPGDVDSDFYFHVDDFFTLYRELSSKNLLPGTYKTNMIPSYKSCYGRSLNVFL